MLTTFVGLRLTAHDGDPGRFVVAGRAHVNPLTSGVTVSPGSGYDGEYVYGLSHDPLTKSPIVHGVLLDDPGYRQQRILLPGLAWLVGRAGAPVDVALIVLNILAAAGAAWAAARLAVDAHRPAWLGLVVGVTPAIVVGIARDLTEPLSWSLALLGVLLWWRGRRVAGSAALVGAALARETALLVAGGLLLAELVSSLRARGSARWAALRAAGLAAIPFGVILAWQAYIAHVWGDWPVQRGGGNLGTPVLGILRGLFDPVPNTSHPLFMRALWGSERLGILLLIGYALWLVVRGRGPLALRASAVAAAVLALSLGAWKHDAQYLRATHEAVGVSLLLVVVGAGTWGRRIVVGAAGTLTAVIALTYVALI